MEERCHGHSCPAFDEGEFSALKTAFSALEKRVPSQNTMERMIAAVATANARMTSIASDIRELKTLPTEFAAHRAEFQTFKKAREGNGQPGMCQLHADDIGELKVGQAKSAGRREVWMALAIGILVVVIAQFCLLGFSKSVPDRKVTIQQSERGGQ